MPELGIVVNRQHSRLIEHISTAGRQPEILFTSGLHLGDLDLGFPDVLRYADFSEVDEVIAAFITLYENRVSPGSSNPATDDETQQKALEVERLRATLAAIKSMPNRGDRTVRRLILIR